VDPRRTLFPHQRWRPDLARSSPDRPGVLTGLPSRPQAKPAGTRRSISLAWRLRTQGALVMLDVGKRVSSIPFDVDRLDRLMDETGIDVLLATSKHNVQYLLGGHRAFFFDYMDAMGLSRYLPIVIYPKGAPGKAAFFGHRLENFQREVAPFWTPVAETAASGSVDVMGKATDYLRKSGVKARRIGVELAFLPADAATALRKAQPESEI